MEETWVRRESLGKERRESFGKEEKRLRRESLGKDFERKLNMKPEMSIQKCKEEIAFFNAQTEKIFEEERGLVSGGLNPKLASEVAFVSDADVEELFGKCTKLRTTNTFFKPDTRKDLMDLYSKIYGSLSVTNNEFSGWLVKGYIANLKKKKVNWALAASTTASEKADRAHRLMLRLLNPECSDDGTSSGFKHSTCTSQRDEISGRSVGAMVKVEGAQVRLESAPSGAGCRDLCPYGVSANDLDVVRGVSQIESEILGIATSKIKFVEAECKKIGDRLVGFKFTMEDRRITAKEDEAKVLQLQAEFERATKAVLELELQAIGTSVGCVEHDEFKQKLGILRSNKDSLERRLDVSRSVAESSRERAMKGEDFYQDIEEEQMRAGSDLQILRREIVDIKRHIASVEEQCVQMEKGGGLSLWPKPALHPPMANDVYMNPPTLQLHPCVFCNRGYPYFDIVIASCKHIYHIFCAAALAKVDNRCTRCDEVFHPHWWQNFGFRVAYAGLEDETLRLELPAKIEELRHSLKEDGSLHVLNWSQSSLKHSDWGSCGSIQRGCNPISAGRSIATASVHRLPSLASNTPSEEPNSTELGLALSNSRGQEVDSPVKNRSVERCAIVIGDIIGNPELGVAAEGEPCENSKLLSESELPDIPKLRCTLLKRRVDLPEDDGDGRKKVALNALGQKNVHVALELDNEMESNAEETTECTASDKGKAKVKGSKRKTREQPPCTTVGRVSTRADTKRK